MKKVLDNVSLRKGLNAIMMGFNGKVRWGSSKIPIVIDKEKRFPCAAHFTPVLPTPLPLSHGPRSLAAKARLLLFKGDVFK